MNYLSKRKDDSLFTLSESFIDQFKEKQPEWGPVGYLVYKRTYARPIDRNNPKGKTEEFWQTCRRVVETVFSIQKIHCSRMSLPWSDEKAEKSARDMFFRMWEFKFLPPGRGLWAMDFDLISVKGGACLNNCSFTTTKHIDNNFSEPFAFLADMSMLGVGVGSDTRGKGKVLVGKPKYSNKTFVVKDTREGWVELIRMFCDSVSSKKKFPGNIDYSMVRKKGTPIKTFGGTASGPGPLIDLIENLKKIYSSDVKKPITSSQIVDTFNYIGKCVVSGGVRRTAEIMFGEYEDEEFLDLKNDMEALSSRRWASNNSIFAKVGMDYGPVVQRTVERGEPGYLWLDNAREYSRMKDPKDNKDREAMGANPCLRGDMRLLTPDGYVAIKDLVGECVVMNENGDFVPAKVWSNGHKDIVKIERKGFQPLFFTPEHEFKTLEGETVEAKDLEGFTLKGRVTPWDEFMTEVYTETGSSYANMIKDHREKNNLVTSVTNVENDEVFDFSLLEGGTHWGVCEGVIVHNCNEQSLEDKELCCLVETFPANHDDYNDYQKTLKMAYLYAKTVTLIPTHNTKTNAVMMKNRRIGCSMSGIVQAFTKFGRKSFLDWCDEGYSYLDKLDTIYSDWFCIPRSIKKTSIKPSGSVSKLPGVFPGIHDVENEFYIQRIRIADTSPLIKACKDAGYHVEDAVAEPDTVVVSIPVKEKLFKKSKYEVSAWEQVTRAIDIQKYWADNQVSITVTFQKHEKDQLESILEFCETRLKGISFLPLAPKSDGPPPYPQMPMEAIDEDQYKEMTKDLKPLNLSNAVHELEDKFCDGDNCKI